MLIRVSMDMLYCTGLVGVDIQVLSLWGGGLKNTEIQKYRSCLRINRGWRETDFWDVCKNKIFHSILIFMLIFFFGGGRDSKYNNTEIQELSLPKKTRKLSSGCNHHVSPHRRHRLAVGGGWLRCQLGHREPRRPSQSTLMARLKDRHWSEHGGGRLFQINPPSSAFASWKKRKSPPFQKFQEK